MDPALASAQPATLELEGPNGTRVRVVGTCHSGRESVAAVRAAILSSRPAAVVVEMCPARLRGPEAQSVVVGGPVGFVWPGFAGIALPLLAAATHALYGDDQVSYGDDMKVAMESADEVGALLLLGDRNVYVTLARLFVAGEPLVDPPLVPSWRVAARAAAALLLDDRPALASALAQYHSDGRRAVDDAVAGAAGHAEEHPSLPHRSPLREASEDVWVDVLRGGGRAVTRDQAAALMRYFATAGDDDDLPSDHWRRVIVRERDIVLTHAVWTAACGVDAGATVVAVVGKGHLPGMRVLWGHTTQPATVQYLQPPPDGTLRSVGPPAAALLAYAAAARLLPRTPRRVMHTAVGATAAVAGVAVWRAKVLLGDLSAAVRAARRGEGQEAPTR